jgi:hypothetical protein
VPRSGDRTWRAPNSEVLREQELSGLGLQDGRLGEEGLESLPYLARSLQAFTDGHVAPSAIGLRMDPGKSDGILKISLCADGLCAFGARNLKGSEDNEPFQSF